MNDKNYQFRAPYLKINGKLGKGDNSEVFEVDPIIPNTPITLKVYSDDISKYSTEIIDNLSKQLEILTNLQHKTIVEIYGYSLIDFDSEPHLSILMEELKSYYTIQDKLSSSDTYLSHTQQLILIYGISLGMKYLHSFDIIHKNLKPKNIFIGSLFLPQINSYYSLHKFDQDKNDPIIDDDLIFIPPEIWTGEKYTKSSDVYSFAILSYQILNLNKPFQNLNLLDIISKVVQGNRPDFDPSIPECYQQLIQKCWSPDPKERPSFEEIERTIKNDPRFILDYEVHERIFKKYVEIVNKGNHHQKQRYNLLIEQQKTNNFEIYHQKKPHGSSLQHETNENPNSKFRKDKKIGEGGFSEVYKIFDLEDNKCYAAKISKKEIPDLTNKNDIDAVNFIRECKIMSQLNHLSILKYIGYYNVDFKNKKRPVVIIEYSSNGSLDKILELEQKSLSIDDWNSTKKLICIYGIASAMLYLHKNEILHLDLKAANILVDENLYPKLSDFGLAMKIDEITPEIKKIYKGTPTHSAPEIWKNKGYTKEVDVYAFALTVYEIVTNDKPFFESNGIFQIINDVATLGKRPQFKCDIPNCYKSLIEKCWSQNPADRPSFEDIVNDLRSDSAFINDAFVDEKEFFDFIDLLDDNPTMLFINPKQENSNLNKTKKQNNCLNNQQNKIDENEFTKVKEENE